MNRFLCLVVCACLGVAPLFSVAEPAPGKSIEQLIEQLGDKDFKVRDAAIKAIEALGPDALPGLRKAKDHPDPEVRRHIERWLPLFEKEDFVRPKRVTLKLADRPLREAVAELARQTGYKIDLTKDEEREKKLFTFELDKATFWEALHKICSEGAVELQQGGEEGTLLLQYTDTHAAFVARHGAFRLAAQSISFQSSSSTSRSLQLGMVPRQGAPAKSQENKSESKSLYLQCTLQAEPRLTLLGVGTPTLTEALDDQSNSLLPKGAEVDGRRARFARAFAGLGRGFMSRMPQYVALELQVPTKDARTLKVLRGSVPVYVEKEKKSTVIVDNIKEARGKKFTVGSLTVEVDHFKEGANGQYSLYVTMTQAKANDGQDDGEDGLELQDAKGIAYQAFGRSSNSDGTTTRASYTFGPPFNGGAVGPPVKLVHTTRVSLEYHVNFAFNDLPLP